MKKLLLICVLLFITCPTGFATTWVQISDSDYIDKDSIKYYVNDHGSTNYNKKVFWVKDTNITNDAHKKLEKLTKKHISYGITQCIFDLQNNQKAFKSGITYDKEGNSISSFSFKDFELEWSPIVPNSKAEYWAELVKKPRLLKQIYKYQQEQHK